MTSVAAPVCSILGQYLTNYIWLYNYDMYTMKCKSVPGQSIYFTIFDIVVAKQWPGTLDQASYSVRATNSSTVMGRDNRAR